MADTALTEGAAQHTGFHEEEEGMRKSPFSIPLDLCVSIVHFTGRSKYQEPNLTTLQVCL